MELIDGKRLGVWCFGIARGSPDRYMALLEKQYDLVKVSITARKVPV
jgi:hypothetical protein